MYWLLTYDVVDDYPERRATYRAEHLALAAGAHERAELLYAGAVGEPIRSTLLVFKGIGDAAARAFVEADPYVRNGLVRQWRIEPWHVVVGG